MRIGYGLVIVMMIDCIGPGSGWTEDWKAFRGSRGDAISHDTGFPTEWTAEKNIKWKIALSGEGNSSPIVSKGRVFVTSATDAGTRRILSCFDRTNGNPLWSVTVRAEADEPTHRTNPYCGSTPVTDGMKVVVWHGSAGVYCYDFAGKALWSQKSLGKVTHNWGYGSSPIIHKNRVYLNYGPGVNSFVTALNLQDGSIVWKTDEPGGSDSFKGRLVGSWCTPAVIQVSGQDQILCGMPRRVVAYHPERGNILWTCGGLVSDRGDLVYASLMLTKDYGVALGGFHGPALAFKYGGQGDVTERNRLWHHEDRQPVRIGSGVIVGDYLYVGNGRPNTIECLELRTGERQWQQRAADRHWASVVYAGGNLYAHSQDGSTTVFKPNPKAFEFVALNQLEELTNSTPAFSDGDIIQRTNKHLYCIAE